MPEIAISAQDFTRRFGKFIAVDRVNFQIHYGEIFGFLGPNGAGKSTTIRMLCGILAPSSGNAMVAGLDVNRESELIKQAIGYVSQRFSLYGDLTVEENLRFYGEIYGITGQALQKRLEEVLAVIGLSPWRNRLAGELSGGWKQKLSLANAILHRPRILFLDEPTAGLDPLSRRSVWEFLYQLADQGVTLFVTTHYMEEAERCHQIAIINDGQLLKIGTPLELKSQIAGNLLEVECRPLMKASRLFRSLSGVVGITAYGTTLHLNVQDLKREEQKILLMAKEQSIQIISIRPIEASLEDIFATITEENSATTL